MGRKESLLSAIHDLIAQVSDLRLRERLAAEWASASKEKKFGLVFEDHLPELLPLYKARPRRSALAAPRGYGRPVPDKQTERRQAPEIDLRGGRGKVCKTPRHPHW